MFDKKMTYKQAGVDIEKANSFVRKIKPLINSVRSPKMLGEIGGFSGFFDMSGFDVENPVLVSSTDGVGTKLLLAKTQNMFNTVGIDLVAMCVNDIVTCGAKPLFFLDYFSTGKLFSNRGEQIIKGIVDGCKYSECVLLGGETAEMPDVYAEGDFDLAGFCVGIVNKNKIISGKKVKKDDVVIGIQSNGVHSNGFSLIRKIFNEEELNGELGRELLKPTCVYVKPILKLIEKTEIKAIANITGGGLIDNIPRVLPDDVKVDIDRKNWSIPEIFIKIKKRANISKREMFNTFNMGIGMIVVVARDDVDKVKGILKNYYNLKSYVIGYIEQGKKEVAIK